MATRSRIGIEREDGTIVSVYCHWDGYPEHVGRILNENYYDREKAEQLVALGDLSSLAQRPEPDGIEHHSFTQPAEGVTVAYHRDRGEEFSQRIDSDRAAWEASDLEEYGYLFTREGEWITYRR